MKKISKKNLPNRLPIMSTIMLILALDYWNAHIAVWITIMLFALVGWFTSIDDMIKSQEIDIFEEHEKNKPKKSFKEKLDEAMDKVNKT